jgi:serine/threonine-protein kinase
MNWAPGARFGDYVIDRALPIGGHDLAFAASHAVLPRRVRIRTVHAAFGGASPAGEALLREARVLETLRCAGIPRLFECGALSDRRPWIAVEDVGGPTLARAGYAEAVVLLREVAAILAHAHGRGVIHRNLRPEVIVPGTAPIVLGWSDARISGVPNASARMLPEDGLAYRAPELVTGDDHDERVDVFALGVVLYQAISGALPMAVPLARRCPAIPARLAELVDRMLLVDPLARPNAAEVRAAAARIADQLDRPLPATEPADAAVDEVPVELIELIDDVPPPIPDRLRSRWTPPLPYDKTPPPVITGTPAARSRRT